MKKAVVLNGSPNGLNGNTGFVVEPFIKGLKDGGAEVFHFDVARMKILPCRGDHFCWTKHPGRCYQQDDMPGIIEALDNCSILVFASPVYVDGMTAQLKTALDRLICTGQPFVEIIDGRMRHPPRKDRNHETVSALISTCGFWEIENFDPLVTHIKAVSNNLHARFAGALLRPHAPVLNYMKNLGLDLKWFLDIAENAGKTLAESGSFNDSHIEGISRPLVDKNEYCKSMNEHWKKIT